MRIAALGRHTLPHVAESAAVFSTQSKGSFAMKLASFVCLFLFTTAALFAQSNPAALLTRSPRPTHSLGSSHESKGSSELRMSYPAHAPGVNFEPPVMYPSGGGTANSVVVADVNGDGNPDLVVANVCVSTQNCNNGEVSVLLGNGDGTFQPAITYGSGGYEARSVSVGDVNNDGKPDLVVVNQCATNTQCVNGTVGVLLGNGNGTFSATVAYDSGGGRAFSVAVQDVNADHNADMVIANLCASSDCTSGSVSVLFGKGDGTFSTAVAYGSGGYEAFSIAVGDVNGDGHYDLLVANQCANSSSCSNSNGFGTVGVLLGNGDGTFKTAVAYGSGGAGALSVAIADVNGDSKPDLLVANNCIDSCEQSGVGVLLGNGDGTFQPAVTYISQGESDLSVAVADVNGDGNPDLVVATYCFDGNCLNGGVSILQGNGDGTFQQGFVYDSGGYGGYAVALTDLNQDGKPDVIVVNQCGSGDINCQSGTNGTVGVLINLSTKTTTTSLVSSPNSSNFAQGVAFTANVTPKGTGVPTGIVTFLDGATSLGSSSLTGSGVAVVSTSTLAVGTHSITAVYSGDANFAASTSPALSQVVQGAIAVVSPTAINFGNQTVGMTGASQTVTLSNTGNVTLTLSSIALSLNNGSGTQTNNCGTALTAGATCTVNLFWIPGKAGSMTGNLTFTDNAPNSPQVVALSGVGVLPAVTLAPTKLIFSTQVVFTTSASQTATLTNTGLGILNISKVSLTGPFSQTNNCGKSVAAGASCTFTVTFKPTTIGTLTGAISITDNAGNSPQSLALTGFGTYVRLNPTSLMFGNQPVGTKSPPKRVTLSNKGSVAVSITGISFTGTNAADFAETNTCGTSVAAGASCSITVTFAPSATGNRTATLSVTDNGGASPQKVSVAGTGT
jgi:Bacterial Ig-like domain (group 3)/FG-GAP-like repeat/HYDIN/CFA65/VesB-like, Ig-like domain/Abnormal spindle-like microcephaly-assoc'd, ASPM-SPD-2-Hydin